MSPVALQIVFPPPRFMLPVGSVTIRLDGYLVHQAPFTDGVNLTVPVVPGRHQVEARIELGGLVTRTRRYDIEVMGPTRMELRYSRVWGSFSRRPRVSAALAPGSGQGGNG